MRALPLPFGEERTRLLDAISTYAEASCDYTRDLWRGKDFERSTRAKRAAHRVVLGLVICGEDRVMPIASLAPSAERCQGCDEERADIQTYEALFRFGPSQSPTHTGGTTWERVRYCSGCAELAAVDYNGETLGVRRVVEPAEAS